MIYVLCIEDNKLYYLSGDDDSFEISEVDDKFIHKTDFKSFYLKLHKEDFLRRVAEAKLAGFNSAFHCHQRAYLNKQNSISKVLVVSTSQGSGKSWLYDKWKKQREIHEKFSSLPIEYKHDP